MPSQSCKSSRPNPLELNGAERAVAAGNVSVFPGHACCTDLFLGVFFDGTNNNRERDLPNQAHSNVARLAALYGAKRRPEILPAVYAQGVGTPFKEIGDTGRGIHRDAGLASAWAGEARLNWALLQVQNAIHSYYFAKQPLTSPAQDTAVVKQISADLNLSSVELRAWVKHPVRTALQQKVVEPRHAARRALLRQRDTTLREKISPFLTSRKPTVKKLRLAVFGFSRGAAQARVFVNWLLESCTPGGETGQLIAGIPLQVDFLGLFDTVASVGYAQSFQEFFLEGHDAWATPQALQVPKAVRRCVHFTAAHEVRGSFPLDSVAGAPGSWKEVIYPGVHSDVGGGYLPGEQGRSPQDADKLSQIPLADMYREAIMAGVPLDFDKASSEAKAAMEVSLRLRQAFNAYLDAAGKPQDMNTRSLLEQHYGLYLRWRKMRLGRMASVPALAASTAQDRTDLLEADAELAEEVRLVTNEDVQHTSWLKKLSATLSGPDVLALLWARKMDQWRQMKTYWTVSPPLPQDVTAFFDAYLHDSRAWFKPFADNDEDWAKEVEVRARQSQALKAEATREEAEARTAPTRGMAELHHRRGALARSSARSLDSAATVQDHGREPYLLGWGYLRWRTIYTCFDESLSEVTARQERIRQASAGPRGQTPAEVAAARRRAELEEERSRWQGEQLDARDARVAQQHIERIDQQLARMSHR